MKILIAGGTGLIGKTLTKKIISSGNKVFILTWNPGNKPKLTNVEYIYWDGTTQEEWVSILEEVDCIINLTGESLGKKRWSGKQKEEIIKSRVNAGKVLSLAAARANKKPSVFIQASAIGYYGVSNKEIFTENSPPGNDFLSEICLLWENSSKPIEDLNIRRVIIRIGVVLSEKEGVLERIVIPFKWYIGGPIGNGKQVISWIHLVDVIDIILEIMNNPNISGILNLVAPTPVANEELGRTIGKTIKKPFWLPVPAFLLKFFLGEMSTLVLDGQNIQPRALLELGYQFKFPGIKSAINDLLS